MNIFCRVIRKMDRMLHPGKGEIWMLHRIVDEKSAIEWYHRWEITPQYLEQLIETYKERGYRFVSMDDVCRFIKKEMALPKFVCITLDDGHLDNYTTALPIFEKYQVPFCIYITPGYITGDVEAREDEHIPMMTIDMVRELSQHPLCTIGSHTMTHPHLNRLSMVDQTKEIVGAKDVLEQWIQQPVLHFASPYCDYNKDTIQIVKTKGLLSHVIGGGPIRSNSNLFCMPRVEQRE